MHRRGRRRYVRAGRLTAGMEGKIPNMPLIRSHDGRTILKVSKPRVVSKARVVRLDARPSSARDARQFLRANAKHLHLPAEQVALGQLAVSELVTNALVHGMGPISVRAFCGRNGVRVEVGDSSPRTPRMWTPSSEYSGAHGLPIVAAIAQEWGWDDDETGKRVWFTLLAA